MPEHIVCTADARSVCNS